MRIFPEVELPVGGLWCIGLGIPRVWRGMWFVDMLVWALRSPMTKNALHSIALTLTGQSPRCSVAGMEPSMLLGFISDYCNQL